jgi:hypothetical protein
MTPILSRKGVSGKPGAIHFLSRTKEALGRFLANVLEGSRCCCTTGTKQRSTNRPSGEEAKRAANCAACYFRTSINEPADAAVLVVVGVRVVRHG